MSVAESLFNVVADGKHSITPTDAIRAILGSGMKLNLEECRGHILADAVRANGDRVSTKGERLDEALTKLVGKLIYGERIIERTDWSFPTKTYPLFGTAAGVGTEFWISWTPVKGDASDAAIDALVGSMMYGIAEKNLKESLYAVVLRDSDNSRDVRVGCTTAMPIPPVGATLLKRIHYSAEEAIELMTQGVDKLGFEKVLIDIKSGREFLFSSSGAAEPGKIGKISWEIYNEKAPNVPMEAWSPHPYEADDLYETLTYRFASAGTYRVRMIISYNDKDCTVRDLILDVE